MMKDALYGGVNAAVLTPMTPISLSTWIACRALPLLLANGCNGLAVLGTTGSELLACGKGSLAGGPGRARHSGVKDAPGCGNHRHSRHRPAHQTAESLGCRGALLLRHSITRPVGRRTAGLLQRSLPARRRSIALYLYKLPATNRHPFTSTSSAVC